MIKIIDYTEDKTEFISTPNYELRLNRKGHRQKINRAGIDAAKAAGAKKIILYFNTKLEAAIHLYKKFGFTEIPLLNTQYIRSNILMQSML